MSITINVDARTYATLMIALQNCERRHGDEQFRIARHRLRHSVARELMRDWEFNQTDVPALLRPQAG